MLVVVIVFLLITYGYENRTILLAFFEKILPKTEKQEEFLSQEKSTSDMDLVQAYEEILGEQGNVTVEEQVQEQEEEIIPLQEEALTQEPVFLRNYYLPKGVQQHAIPIFRANAEEYLWEQFTQETQQWETLESRMGVDELYRKVSFYDLTLSENPEAVVLRCSAILDGVPMEETATIYPMKKEIEKIEPAKEVYEVNAGSYISANSLPVIVYYKDGSKEEIEGLLGLYFVEESSQSEYSNSISGNLIETITKVIKDMEYKKAELGEIPTILRFRYEEQVFDFEIKLQGKDLKEPSLLKVECGDFKISNTDQNVLVPVTITAVDNHTPLEELQYCFLPQGKDPDENDWTKENSWNVPVDKNGVWVAYVKDQEGNIAKEERELITVDEKVPELTLSTEKTDWCTENVIKATATDSSQVLYRFYEKGMVIPEEWSETSEFSVTHNGTYLVEAKDQAENISSQEIHITNIDNQVPQILGITESGMVSTGGN